MMDVGMPMATFVSDDVATPLAVTSMNYIAEARGGTCNLFLEEHYFAVH
jgi:hypothetical protein